MADSALVYIVEDSSKIPQEIKDADGNTLKYQGTYIRTEYVWRTDGDQTKYHSNAEQSNKYQAIPDIVGDYSPPYDGDLFNTFLEFRVYNEYGPDKGNLKVTKDLQGAPASANSKEFKVTVKNADGKYVKADGTLSDDEVQLTVSKNTALEIANLPVGTYTVTELENGRAIDNYTFDAEGSTVEVNASVTKGQTAEAKLKNVYEQDLGIVEITKTFSGLPDGADTSKLSFTITIGDETKTVTYADFTDGKYTIPDLPIGTKVSVEETNAEDLVVGYELVADKAITKGEATIEEKDQVAEISLENPYEQIKTEASVKKVWDDNENADGKRPESLKVTLSNGMEFTLNEDNGWSAKVEGLPKYQDDKEINYTWSESSMPEGYTLVSSTKDGTVTTLTNKYTAPDKGVASINPPVQKIIEGKAPKKAETYTFKLEATNPSNPMPKAAGGSSSMTMNIKGEGIKEFGKIEFTEPGVYAYIVSEVMGDNEDCEYDDTIYTVIATVTEGSDGKLQVTREYKKDGASVSTATFQFVNTYDGEDESSGAKTGDDSGIMGLLALMSASAAGLAALCVRRRREEQ